MKNERMESQPGDAKRRTLRLLLTAFAVMLLAAGAPSGAVEVPSLYTAQVPVPGNDADSRNRAYADALAQVVVRITGSRDAQVTGQLGDLFPDPARYVMQYRPGEDNTLWVTLDGDAIERILLSSGHSVWNSDRPLTLVWLAVDWGQGEREIVGADDAQRSADEGRSIDRNRLLRERVEEVAQERGIPVAFPLLDAEDLEKVTFGDIWGGFDDQLLEASQRYGAASILVGRVRPGPAQRNRWSHYFGGEQREWTGEPEEVVNLLADTLGAQFAISGDERLASIPVTVSGIDSVVAYGTVQSYLENLALVQHLAIDEVSGDQIRFVVRAHGDRERLRRALEAARNLEPDTATGPTGTGNPDRAMDALTFRYRP